MTTELYIIFSGRVQGVGFRYTTKKYAKELGLLGAVRNLPDGSVELVAQGPKHQLERLIQQLDEEAFPNHITEKKIQFRDAVSTFPDFQILDTPE